MQRGFSAKLAALLLFIAGAAFYGSLSSSASTPKPSESAFKVAPNVVGGGGGSVLLSAKVSNGTKCIFLVSPAVPGFAYNHACSSGIVSYKAILPQNSSTSKKVYSFRIEVKGKAGQATVVSPTVTATVNTSSVSVPPSGNSVNVPAGPMALVQSGNDIWVASCTANAVTEIDMNTNQVVNTFNNSLNGGFSCPDALAFDGNDIWVGNHGSNSVTEISASTGAWVRTISSSSMYYPISLAVAGNTLWIGNDPNSNNPSQDIISLYDITTGNFKSGILGGALGQSWIVSWPIYMVYDGTNMLVADQGGFNVSEFNDLNGSYVGHTTNIGGPNKIGLSGVGGVSYHSGYIWASGTSNYVLVEYNAKTGAYVRSVQHVGGPEQLIFNGINLFVISTSPTASVKEYNAEGIFIKNIANSNYEIGRGYAYTAISLFGNKLWVADYRASKIRFFTI